MADAVETHYGRGHILDSIVRALRETGKDVAQLSPVDLALVDEFHIRGREATIELARRAALGADLRLLDVGCGLGGSARYLAREYGCRVCGVDLTKEHVDAAAALADLVGMKDVVTFRQANAVRLPFDDGSFDVVWTEHVQMNIADKRAFYGQIARVLAPRGRLVFHDIFQGSGGAPHFPVPWADEPSISFLAPPAAVRDTLETLGFSVLDWEDCSRQSLEWFGAVVEKVRASGPPPLGIHLLMGDTARPKLENMVRNLAEQRVAVVQAVVRKV